MDVKAAVERMKGLSGLKTDAELADKLSVPVGTLNSWKKRKSIPLEALARFCAVYEASFDYIISGTQIRLSGTIEGEIRARAYRLGARIALETSGLPRQTVDLLLGNFDYFEKMIAALVTHQLQNSDGLTMDQAFRIQESALRETYPSLPHGAS